MMFEDPEGFETKIRALKTHQYFICLTATPCRTGGKKKHSEHLYVSECLGIPLLKFDAGQDELKLP